MTGPMGGDKWDWDLPLLEVILSALDENLRSLLARMSDQPWDENVRDSADHMAGIGFVACQKYITAITVTAGVYKTDALDRGPRCAAGPSVVSVINAAANAWKHEDEWQTAIERRQQRTFDVLDAVLDDASWEFKYVNTLYVISPDLRFSLVLDALVEWRDDLRLFARSA